MNVFSRFVALIENLFGGISLSIENFGHRYLLAPCRWLLTKIDPLSRAIEGTLFKKILQVVIFPLFITLAYFISLELVKNGYTRTTLMGNVLFLLFVGIIFAPLERLIPFSRKWLDDKEWSTDVMVFFGNSFCERFVSGPLQLATIAIILQNVSPHFGYEIWPTQWHPVAQVFLMLTVSDFFRYWYHRWMHTNEFMWRWHSVHHSSKSLYWFNGNRNHVIEHFISGILWAIPLSFVKASVEIAFVAGVITNLITRFQHTNMDLILGPLDYIFASPKNHRYHHSKKIEEGNSNYGGDVMFWDLLFGTFHLPKGKQPSDDVGLAALPNYPQNWLGLMLAPFTYGYIKKEAEKISDAPATGVLQNDNRPSDFLEKNGTR